MIVRTVIKCYGAILHPYLPQYSVFYWSSTWYLHTAELHIELEITFPLKRCRKTRFKRKQQTVIPGWGSCSTFRRTLLQLQFNTNNYFWQTSGNTFIDYTFIMEFKTCKYIKMLPSLPLKTGWIITQVSTLCKKVRETLFARFDLISRYWHSLH